MADAATIRPKFVPNSRLLPRDDSGGPDWNPPTLAHSGDFGDGGRVTGSKSYLSASGGTGTETAGKPTRRRDIMKD